MINSFKDDYYFLSNFFPCRIEYNGEQYPSVEHAFQASKSLDPEIRELFQDYKLSPSNAKKLGRRVDLRYDWEDVKLNIMRELIEIKFSDNTLKHMLISTYPKELIEGNNWGDTFWGVCNKVGKNNLGKILMSVRETFNKSHKYTDENQ